MKSAPDRWIIGSEDAPLEVRERAVWIFAREPGRRWARRRRLGPLRQALLHGIIDAGMRVSWFTLVSFTATVGPIKVDESVAKVIARFCRIGTDRGRRHRRAPDQLGRRRHLPRRRCSHKRRSAAGTSKSSKLDAFGCLGTMMPKACQGVTVDPTPPPRTTSWFEDAG